MAFSTIDKGSLYQDGKIYLGSASAVTVSGLDFQPGFVWVKDRDNANTHCLVDAVRGVGNYLESNDTTAEIDNSTNSISAFTSDGFTTGTANPANEAGSTTKGFMSWNWKLGTTSGITGGTITPSSYSINATSGVGIYKYTNNTVSGATIAHGLNSAPKVVIIKLTSHTGNWITGHVNAPDPFDKFLKLNTTDGVISPDGMFTDTLPSSTLITIGNNSEVNYSISAGSYHYVMYAFAEVPGFSKFGGYTGNGGTNGAFIYTGFKPSFVLVKVVSEGNDWKIFDDKRDPENFMDLVLYPNNNNVESVEGAAGSLDMLSNGFKLRSNYASMNGSGKSYVYMAFGQPIISNSGVSATAR